MSIIGGKKKYKRAITWIRFGVETKTKHEKERLWSHEYDHVREKGPGNGERKR